MRGTVEQHENGGIDVAPDDDGSRVTLRGEIDGQLRDQAGLAMAEVVARGGPVTVDLAQVTFIDSSGLAFLLQLHRLGEEDPALRMVLRDPPTLVLDMLDMLGLGGRIPLDFTPGDAVEMEGVPVP